MICVDSVFYFNSLVVVLFWFCCFGDLVVNRVLVEDATSGKLVLAVGGAVAEDGCGSDTSWVATVAPSCAGATGDVGGVACSFDTSKDLCDSAGFETTYSKKGTAIRLENFVLLNFKTLLYI